MPTPFTPNTSAHRFRAPASVVAGAVALLSVVVAASPAAAAPVFVTTGAEGKELRIDAKRPVIFTIGFTDPVSELYGGLFSLRVGEKFADSVSLALYQGKAQEINELKPFATSIVGGEKGEKNDWSYERPAPTLFLFPEPIELKPEQPYTVVLSSDVYSDDATAVFLTFGQVGFADKSGEYTPDGGKIFWELQDPSGSMPPPKDPPPQDPPAPPTSDPGNVPEPAGATLTTLFAAALLTSRRRRSSGAVA